jgi:RHS repeat-associated protein
MTGFSWNDGGLSPSVSFGYDAGSRLTSVNNANANITRAYFNDNLLRLETESITGASSKTVTYSYDADGNPATTQYPDTYTFNYTYTGRNQLQAVTNYATFGYDARGNLTTRTPANGRQSTYAYDNLDRVTQITPSLNGTTRTFDYGYQTNSYDRKWTKHEDGYGDVFGYDLADQVIAVLLDVSNPDTTPVGDPTITYDGSGNRTMFAAYQWQEMYTVNNLNQYTGRGLQDNPLRPTPTPRPPPTPPPHPSPTPTPTPGQQAATYDYNGNMTTGFDGSTYIYDAQNRLLSATSYGVTMTFTYDGLNRQVSRDVTPPGDGPESATTFSVWDGWDLIEEYHADGTIIAAYLYGAGGLIKNLTSGNHYYQDASGSSSHLTDSTGHLLEWYRYDLQGTPFFYDTNDNQLWASAYNVRHLFTGQQWYSDIGLYDLRNRFYSPDIGRFLQPDPIGFWGDRTNLYRYVKNNPVTRRDPFGLDNLNVDGGDTYEHQYVFGEDVPPDPSDISSTGFLPGELGGFVPTIGSDNPAFHHDYNPFPRPREDNQPSVQHSTPSTVPPQNPPAAVAEPLPDPGAASVGVSVGGIPLDALAVTAGAVEHGLAGNDYWLSNRGYYSRRFHGNQAVKGYRFATRGSRFATGAGEVFFGAQVGIAGLDLLYDPSTANFLHQGRNLGVGALAFTGPAGFVTAGIYFGIEDTIGWDEFVAEIKPSTILVVPDYF